MFLPVQQRHSKIPLLVTGWELGESFQGTRGCFLSASPKRSHSHRTPWAEPGPTNTTLTPLSATGSHPHHHHNSGLQGVGRRPSELSQASSRSHLLLWGLRSVQKPSICSAHYSLQSFLYTVVAFSLFGKQFSKYIKSETCT